MNILPTDIFGFPHSSVNSLRCWRCSSDVSNGEFCKDPFNESLINEKYRQWSYVDCQLPSDVIPALKERAYPVCKKIIQEGEVCEFWYSRGFSTKCEIISLQSVQKLSLPEPVPMNCAEMLPITANTWIPHRISRRSTVKHAPPMDATGITQKLLTIRARPQLHQTITRRLSATTSIDWR